MILIKPPPPQVLVVATVLFWVAVIDILPPHWGEFSLYSLLVGLPAGLGLSFWKHKVKQHKAENIEKVRFSQICDLSLSFLSGLQTVTGATVMGCIV